MNKRTKQILFWSPRIITILFAVFISIFSLDVFGENNSFWNTILALTIHLIPTAFTILVLIIAWRWEWIGGIMFIVPSVLYVFKEWGRFPLYVYFIVCGPMVLISILFFINWKYRAELRTKQK